MSSVISSILQYFITKVYVYRTAETNCRLTVSIKLFIGSASIRVWYIIFLYHKMYLTIFPGLLSKENLQMSNLCQGCNYPMCGPKCSQLHCQEQECQLLSKLNISLDDIKAGQPTVVSIRNKQRIEITTGFSSLKVGGLTKSPFILLSHYDLFLLK